MVRKNKKITAGILIIGNEILSGRTKDQNVSYLANWLNNRWIIPTCMNMDKNNLQYSPSDTKGPNKAPNFIKSVEFFELPNNSNKIHTEILINIK